MITKLIAKTYFNKNNKNLEPVSQKMLGLLIQMQI